MTPDTQNGRVTMAVLAQKIDHLAEEVAELKGELKRRQERQDADHDELTLLKSRANDHDREIEKLRATNAVWSGFNTFISAVAAMIAGWMATK